MNCSQEAGTRQQDVDYGGFSDTRDNGDGSETGEETGVQEK